MNSLSDTGQEERLTTLPVYIQKNWSGKKTYSFPKHERGYEGNISELDVV